MIARFTRQNLKAYEVHYNGTETVTATIIATSANITGTAEVEVAP